MIEFDCPKCGEQMEVKNRMAGEKVRCVGCDKLVRVPADEDDDEPPPRRRRVAREDRLSGLEFLLFGLAFLFVPCVNVIVSSVLYYVWRGNQPTRAAQINMLGFAVFGFHILLRIFLYVVFKV